LKVKQLPESQLTYEWQSDKYVVTTPARFAPLLGADVGHQVTQGLPLADHLFDFQRFIVEQALTCKRFAVWADTGLGKTAIELEFARQVMALTRGKVLIVTPLQVIPQMMEMARGFYVDGLPLERLATRQALADWCAAPGSCVGITNPEKFIEGTLSELRLLGGLVVDESSLLKTGGGVIKWNLIKSARGIEYKLSATATPAPNDRMEYASQASFLEKLRSEGDVIWTFFRKTKKGDWEVKPRARDAFYRFMASWSIYLRDPAAFGFADILSTLPEPDVREYRLPITDLQRELMYGFVGQKGGLFSDDRLGVKERGKLSQLAKGFHYEKRNGKRLVARVESHKPAFVANLIRADVADGRQVLAWTVFDEESVILSQELAGASFSVDVLDGSMTAQARADVLERFRGGQLQVLISKAQLIGYGLNLQNCRSMVFSGFDDSFERMYQAIRRAHRFGQTESVRVHVPYIPELEGLVFSNVKRKQRQFEEDTAAAEVAYRDALRWLLPDREQVAA
jgi:hypothetical protein